jgi:hypothetical protein
MRVTLIGRQLEQRRSDSKRGHEWAFVSRAGSPPAIAPNTTRASGVLVKSTHRH